MVKRGVEGEEEREILVKLKCFQTDGSANEKVLGGGMSEYSNYERGQCNFRNKG